MSSAATKELNAARERLSGRSYQTGLTAGAVASMLEGIATDKAVRLAALAKSTVILATMPVWVRSDEARALFGVPRGKLYEWAIAKKIVAKKVDANNENSATIYQVKSILKAIDGLMDYHEWIMKREDGEQGTGSVKAEKAENVKSGKKGRQS